jgi:hypothetical protein
VGKRIEKQRPKLLAEQDPVGHDKGADDGVFTSTETSRPGFGNVYVTYFSGKNALPSRRQPSDIFVSRSTDNGSTFGRRAGSSARTRARGALRLRGLHQVLAI